MRLTPEKKAARIAAYKDKMLAQYGEPCKRFAPGCCVCEGWKLFHALERLPTGPELQRALFYACWWDDKNGKPTEFNEFFPPKKEK